MSSDDANTSNEHFRISEYSTLTGAVDPNQLPTIRSASSSPNQHPFILIPQRPYLAENQRGFDQQPPIRFKANGRDGIRLTDALNPNFGGLDGRNDSVFEGVGSTVSYRFEWPGYGSWSKHKLTRDSTSDHNPISRGKVAKDIAKLIKRFIEEKAHQPTSEPHWRIGPNFIEIDRLILLELRHVSKSSWQPVFALARSAA